MRGITIIMFLFTALVNPALLAGELIDQQDRFAQKRELKWVSHVRSSDPSELGLTVSVYFAGSAEAANALVHLAGSFDRLEYASCHSAAWLADGAPIKPSETSYQIQPRKDSPHSIEIVTSVFTIPQLRKLAESQSIEYRICRDEGRVPAEDHAGLRQLVGRLEQ